VLKQTGPSGGRDFSRELDTGVLIPRSLPLLGWFSLQQQGRQELMPGVSGGPCSSATYVLRVSGMLIMGPTESNWPLIAEMGRGYSGEAECAIVQNEV
jgi:hypothetical protein